LALGLPMTFGFELASVILSVGDRYVIKAVIGEAPLGLYAAAYNLCSYVQAVFVASIGDAITPIYMRMWDEEGAYKTSEFVSRSLRDFILMVAPIVAGVASVGPELLPSLASDRYASAGLVIPWVIAGMVVDGAAIIMGAGLFIQKRTKTIMILVAGSALINVASNLVLVPRLGILGAAVSTLVSYAAIFVMFAVAGRRHLFVRMPWGTLARAGFAAVAVFVVLHYLVPGRRFVTVGVRAAVGAVMYPVLIAAIDADARALLKKLFDKLRSR
jgi:O-antigen/teichoic acid export membrane protein